MTSPSPPRRVLMTTDAVGGVWTHALELARGLAGEGTEVLLAVVGPAPDPDQRARAFAIPGLSLSLTGLGLEWQDRRGPLGAADRGRLTALERAFAPDLVHANGFREAAAGFKAPVLLVAHSCVRSWWAACRGGAEPGEGWGAYEAGVRQGLAAADAVAAPSAAYLAALEAAWGRLPGARVVRNGLTLEPHAPVHRLPRVLAAGRLWDEAKNMAALAAVAGGLPWPVEVAGDARPGAGGLDGLRHLGRLPPDRLHGLMAAAEIFAAPARYEPFGLAVLEAAQMGCALVLGNIPTLVELWGDAARFVAPDDTDALRGTLLDLMGDPAARRRLQAAARHRARAYTRKAMTRGYLEAYADLRRRPEGPGLPPPAWMIAAAEAGAGAAA